MFTLRGWQLLIVGLLFVLCVVPFVLEVMTPIKTIYYVNTPIPPPFDPTLSQDIITDYYWIIGQDPPYLWALNYFWVTSSGVKLLSAILTIVSAGLLLVADLRGGGSPVRGREK